LNNFSTDMNLQPLAALASANVARRAAPTKVSDQGATVFSLQSGSTAFSL
jgi:hypothetical protein